MNESRFLLGAYLRGQADALKLSIIDTSYNSPDKSLGELELLVKDLLTRARATDYSRIED